MKVDFHIHSNFSLDALSSPEEIVDAAIEKKIDCICITDHGKIQGATRAMKYGFDKNILVIPGIEILTRSGDILGINVKKIIPDGLTAEETIKEIRKQGGIAVIPHPFGWPVGSFKGGEREFLMADAVEIFNASTFNFVNKKAVDLSKKMNLSFTAGSDAHRAKFVGRGCLEVFKDNLSEKELFEEVKNKTGEIKGKILNFWESIENSLKVDLKTLFNYYHDLNPRKRKVQKYRE